MLECQQVFFLNARLEKPEPNFNLTLVTFGPLHHQQEHLEQHQPDYVDVNRQQQLLILLLLFEMLTSLPLKLK